MERFDVCVRGQGAVGMALALALSGQGLRVALQGARRSTTPTTPDLRTYALNPASVHLLTELKVWDALPSDARTAVHDMRVEGDAGGSLMFSAWDQRLDALAWIVDAAELDLALASALRFARHVTAVDHDAPAALLVLAEGRDSLSREALGVHAEVQHYGQRAVAARLRSDWPHAGLARQWFRSPDVLALLPFDRPAPGCSYGLVWSVPDARAEALLAMAPAEFEQALAEATGGAAGALHLCGERAAWPLVRTVVEPLCGPGWVLVGDAAHAIHPLAGQGLNLGLADVDSLARTLAAREPWRSLGDEKLLRRHVRARRLPVQAMGQVTDGLLRLFASDLPVVRELRNRGMGLLDVVPPLKKLLTARALHS